MKVGDIILILQKHLLSSRYCKGVVTKVNEDSFTATNALSASRYTDFHLDTNFSHSYYDWKPYSNLTGLLYGI